jgi:hypothetical protein
MNLGLPEIIMILVSLIVVVGVVGGVVLLIGWLVARGRR